jgi:hypothetical protein
MDRRAVRGTSGVCGDSTLGVVNSKQDSKDSS